MPRRTLEFDAIDPFGVFKHDAGISKGGRRTMFPIFQFVVNQSYASSSSYQPNIEAAISVRSDRFLYEFSITAQSLPIIVLCSSYILHRVLGVSL